MKHRAWILIAVLALALVGAGGCGHSKSSSTAVITPTDPNSSDQAPPQAPVGVYVPKVDPSSFLLTWTANPEANVTGYRVYRYDPDPARPNAWVKVTTDLVASTSWVYSGDLSNGVLVCVTAVNSSQQESAYSAPVGVVPPKNVVPSLPDPGSAGDGYPPNPANPGGHGPGGGSGPVGGGI